MIIQVAIALDGVTHQMNLLVRGTPRGTPVGVLLPHDAAATPADLAEHAKSLDELVYSVRASIANAWADAVCADAEAVAVPA